MAEPDRTRTRPRDEVELSVAQLRALSTWHEAHRAAQDAARERAGSREHRMDQDRRLDVLRAQHAALVRCTEQALLRAGWPIRDAVPLRAVVAHRNEWFRERVCGELQRHGVVVVHRTDNGAEAVGTSVAEQPDLVLVEDRLALQPGPDVVREVRRYAPWAVVAAQVATDDGVPDLLAAGAHAAFPRRVPPAEVADELARLLSEQPSG